MKDMIRRFPGRMRMALTNCLSLIQFDISGIKRRNHSKIKELKDLHLGQRCFIIGNGPSLTASDLNRIDQSKCPTFAFNRISEIFTETQWRPTYYCVFDEGLQIINKIINDTEAGRKFFRTSSYFWTKNVKGDCIYLPTDGSRELLKAPRFSEDISDVVYSIATVTYVALQIAVYMGFKEIYLLGMDNNYSVTRLEDGTIIRDENVRSYFGEVTEEKKAIIGAQWEMNIAYEVVRNYAEKHGIKLYNATRGGKLEVFDRVDFDSLF